MTDKMREVWDAHDKARNKAWREEPGTFDTLDAFKAGAAWQAARVKQSAPGIGDVQWVPVDQAELERLRVAARALKALLARDMSFVDNIVYFPFESSTQALNHILDARDAAIAAEEEPRHG